ncbi:lysM and putative peptidoglycan-binding domain-containing protein 1 isoform X2 [Anarrhichthys ocellatus]|nr:lysM and putative peptidoglycan-binding domain-containing protein 1 isoform X2 [Anarrhichthys ocellatus]
MELIKRANRLYTNESIFLKKSLWIPVLSDPDHCGNWVHLVGEDRDVDGSGLTGSSSERKHNDDKDGTLDLTPVQFFKRLDGLISQSKRAAVKGCQDAEKRVAAIEAACTSGTSDWRPFERSQSAVLSSRAQQASHVAVPLTNTKLTNRSLRDREDEIFQL